MGMGYIPKDVQMTKTLARSMLLSKLFDTKPIFHKAPLKDTVSVPSSGYTIVRFRADNPGKIFRTKFLLCGTERWEPSYGNKSILF